MGNAPYELLDQWVDDAKIGRALDLGAGEGEVAIWLQTYGFEVEAIEADHAVFQRLQTASANTSIRTYNIDLRRFHFEPHSYQLITAFGVLHFFRPTDLWTVADQIVGSLAPGGLFLCKVYSTDDPGFEHLRLSGSKMIEPNTFQIPSMTTPIHYYEPGEMERVFSALEALETDVYRRIDPDSGDGFRAGISFVGRKA